MCYLNFVDKKGHRKKRRKPFQKQYQDQWLVRVLSNTTWKNKKTEQFWYWRESTQFKVILFMTQVFHRTLQANKKQKTNMLWNQINDSMQTEIWLAWPQSVQICTFTSILIPFTSGRDLERMTEHQSMFLIWSTLNWQLLRSVKIQKCKIPTDYSKNK